MNEEDRGQCRIATVFLLPGVDSHKTEILPRFVKLTDLYPHLLIHVGTNEIIKRLNGFVSDSEVGCET